VFREADARHSRGPGRTGLTGLLIGKRLSSGGSIENRWRACDANARMRARVARREERCVQPAVLTGWEGVAR